MKDNYSVESKPSKGSWWARKSPLFRFFIVFGLSMIIFYAFYYSSIYENYFMSGLLNGQARLSSIILNLFGHETSTIADNLYGKDFEVSIKGGCDGLEATALFISAILAFPFAHVNAKWKGLLAGVFTLGVVNVGRIVLLYLSGIYWPSAFEFLHLHGGVVIFTIIAIAIWIVWVSWAMNNKNKAA